jgi:hypothetical protein
MRRDSLLVALLFSLPLAGFAQAPAAGFPPYGSFAPGGFDAINLQNLDTHLSIPVVTSPGRGTNFQSRIVYDSLLWTEVTTNGTTSWTPVTDSSGNPTWGWTRSPAGMLAYQSAVAGSCKIGGSLVYYNKYYNYQFTDSEGTVHTFPTVSWYVNPCLQQTFGTKSGYASDNSGYYLSNAATVLTPSGAQISPGSQIEDTNGNFASGKVINEGALDSVGG